MMRSFLRRQAPLVAVPLAAALLGPLVTAPLGAQAQRDTTVAPVRRARIATRLSPPLSPRRAFLYSAMLPGFGQSRLDRGTSGALFASVELAAFTMLRRSSADLREAQRYRLDTLPGDFTVSGSTLTPGSPVSARFTQDLIRTRRLHREDWLAVIAFNHLFAGADAFVAAQLWDAPVSLSAQPGANGPMLVATLRW